MDVCSFLGMGREGDSGEKWVGKKGKGVGLGAWCVVPWSHDGAGVQFPGRKSGREISS